MLCHTSVLWMHLAPASSITCVEKFVSLTLLPCPQRCTAMRRYDGPSTTSPLLAALSGNTLPDPVYSSGSQILVSFYSDVNYVRSGFLITYSAVGPSDCAPNTPSCESVAGPTCANCSGNTPYLLPLLRVVNASSAVPDRWELASPQDEDGIYTPRFSHTSTYLQGPGALIVFGGRNMSVAFNDLLQFDPITFDWSVVADPTPSGSPRPLPRHSHAAVALDGGALVVLGGETANGTTSDVWMFGSVALGSSWTRGWSQLPYTMPIPLSEHTATAVGGDLVYLIGGRTVASEFSSRVFIGNLSSGVWTVPRPPTGNDAQVAGHTATYFASAGAIYVVGGFRPDNEYVVCPGCF